MHRLGSKKYKRFNPLFFLLFAVALWLSGCGDSTSTEWGGRGNGGLVTLVNDSLALVYNSRHWETCREIFMSGSECDDGGDNIGLFLVNYRKKTAPLWGDTLDRWLSLTDGYYRDSSVLFSDDENHFGFWKIGEKPRIVGTWKWESPCTGGTDRYGRPWKNGAVLFKMEGSSDCPYAVLDTATGIVSRATFDGADAWLSECDDISYLAGKTMCLKKREGSVCALDLIVDGVETDSLTMELCESLDTQNIARWSGFLFITDVYRTINDWKYSFDRLYEVNIERNEIDTTYPELWLSNNMSTFSDSVQNEIIYYGDDLIVTGGEE